MKKLAVVALGGNALLLSGQKGTIDEQEENVYNTCNDLMSLITKDYNIVITHGNGPQVGNIMLCYAAGAKQHNLPEMPLDIYGSFSQGFIGYMIEQQLRNVLEKKGLERDIITLVTQVLVDKNDAAFKNPTKPVGPYYKREEAEEAMKNNKTVFSKDPRGRGWRRVVPSPKPITVGNNKSIETLARNGQIVVTVGGGGIPVFYVEPNKLQGIDAVIDKDLASSLLAAQIKADNFFILTDIPKVCLHFNTPQEKTLDIVTVGEAEKYLEEGHFAPGSMAPKVRAAIEFINNGGKETIITSSKELGKPEAGTRIVKNK